MFVCLFVCLFVGAGEVSKQTCGQVYYYPNFNGNRDGERLYADLKHNITRRIGFEAVMRVRCSVGMLPKKSASFLCQINKVKFKTKIQYENDAMTFNAFGRVECGKLPRTLLHINSN
jgi:hypothetical protein